MRETHKRSIIKTITWRIIATTTTMIFVYIFTKKITLSLIVGFFEMMSKLIFYYIHERVWNATNWGKYTHK